MPIRKMISVLLLLPTFAIAQSDQRDVWEPFKYFVGNWEGTGKGQPASQKCSVSTSLCSTASFFMLRIAPYTNLKQRIPKERSTKTGDCSAHRLLTVVLSTQYSNQS